MVGPGTSPGAEHVSPQNPCAKILESPFSKGVIDTLYSLSATTPVHSLKEFCFENPGVKFMASDPKRILQALMRASSEAIERH